MRKIISVLLIIAQFAFAGYLVNRGSILDAAEAKKIKEIEENGTQYLFKLESFNYFHDTDEPELSLNLLTENGEGYYYYDFGGGEKAYSRIITAQNGVSVLSVPGPDIPEEGDYVIADTSDFLYDINYSSVNELLSESEREYYNSFWYDEGKFSVNGKIQYVFAVACVYKGELVFTGLRADGKTY